MLAILLTVLKIIGIILLCLLIAVLVVVGLVLFVPIRYRAIGYYRDTYEVKGKLSWLFHFISIKAWVLKDNEPQVVVRLLGIPIYDMQKKKRKEEAAAKQSKGKKLKEKKPKEKKEDTESYNSDMPEPVKPPVPHRPGSEEVKTIEENSIEENSIEDKPVEVNNDKNEVSKETEPIEDTDEKLSDEDGRKIDLINKFKAIWEKCKQALLNIKYTFAKICDKIRNIRGNITYYIELLQEENTRQAFAACKKELLRIWKDIRPKRFNVNILLGMEDPATTGQIIGYCAMLYPLHRGNIMIAPDFEEKVFEADFALKGKITVYVYLIVAYTILFNKNIKHLKKCLLREDS